MGIAVRVRVSVCRDRSTWGSQLHCLAALCAMFLSMQKPRKVDFRRTTSFQIASNAPGTGHGRSYSNANCHSRYEPTTGLHSVPRIQTLTATLTMSQPQACTQYFHTSVNKNRSPIHVVKWTPGGRRLISGSSGGDFTQACLLINCPNRQPNSQYKILQKICKLQKN